MLLDSCPISVPEFACLSLLVDPRVGESTGPSDSPASIELVSTLGENLTVISPLATSPAVRPFIEDLHSYVHSLSSEPYIEYNSEPTKTQAPPPRCRQSSTTLLHQMLCEDTAQCFHGDGPASGGGSSAISPQIFRPSRGGINVYYVVLRDEDIIRRCSSLLLGAPPVSSDSSNFTSTKTSTSRVSRDSGSSRRSSSKASTVTPGAAVMPMPKSAVTSKQKADSERLGSAVKGVILSVGVSGTPFDAFSSSSTIVSLPSRLRDCAAMLANLDLVAKGDSVNGDHKKRHVKALIGSLLLDEEDIKSNGVVEAEEEMASGVPQTRPVHSSTGLTTPMHAVAKSFVSSSASKKFTFSDKKHSRKKKGLSFKVGGGRSSSAPPIVSTVGGEGSSTSSADVARIVTEQMQILSLAEHDMSLRQYEGRQRDRRSSSRKKNRSPVRQRGRLGRITSGGSAISGDLAGFDFEPPEMSKDTPSSKRVGIGGADMLRQNLKIEKDIAADQPNSASVTSPAIPTLMAPRKDSVATSKQSKTRTSNRPSRRVIMASNKERSGQQQQSQQFIQRFPQQQQQQQPGFDIRDPAFSSTPPSAPVFNAFKNDGEVGFKNRLNEAMVQDTQQHSFGRSSHLQNARRQKDGDHTDYGENDMEAIGDVSQTSAQSAHKTLSDPYNIGGPSSIAPPSVTGVTKSTGTTSNTTVTASVEESAQSVGTVGTFATTKSAKTFQTDYFAEGASSDGQKHPHIPFYAARPDGTPRDVALSSTMASSAVIGGAAADRRHITPPLHSTSGRASPPQRLVVNVALNEDLSCSYKQSKISACSIEGVIQVQLKTDLPEGMPFRLSLRDPSGHIRAIQENTKYVDDVSDEVEHSEKGSSSTPDYEFAVTVPKADNYFPIMRYKCSSELRPVPIRVQTRVRMYGMYCRVALQISSNPANEDDLTDLTIIMAVPPEIKGETLTTSPAGGVWNSAKRSVLWCVAELGEGEKFQLQAQFEMDHAAEDDLSSEKPSFPVMVRCQCMYAQLSDIELDVSDMPDIFPADVTMKLARRFRLSHKEKS